MLLCVKPLGSISSMNMNITREAWLPKITYYSPYNLDTKKICQRAFLKNFGSLFLYSVAYIFVICKTIRRGFVHVIIIFFFKYRKMRKKKSRKLFLSKLCWLFDNLIVNICLDMGVLFYI